MAHYQKPDAVTARVINPLIIALTKLGLRPGADQSRLCGTIVYLPALAYDAGHGRDGDDAPALFGPHHRHDERLHDIVETIETGIQNLVPFGVGKRGESVVPCHAGVADNAVVGAVRLQIALERVAGRGTVGDVELQHRGPELSS